MQQKKKNKSHRSLSLFLAVSIIFSLFVPCISAHAFSVYTTQVTVDDIAWQIIAGVVKEDIGFWSDNSTPNEARRIGSTDLDSMANNGGSPSTSASLLSSLDITAQGEAYTTTKQTNLIMTYPGKIQKSLMHESSTANDMERATIVKDTLLYDLNSAYAFVFDNEKPRDITEYKNNMVSLLNATASLSSVNGASFRTPSSSEINVTNETMTANDYVAITKGDKTGIFAYRMAKGYAPVSGCTLPNGLKTLSSGEDIAVVTWGEFAYEAFKNYVSASEIVISNENVYSGTIGSLEKSLVGMLNSFINFLAGALGLWNLDELVFNAGIRGGETYIGGIFPSSWETVIWTLFYVVEVLAIAFLFYSILHNIFKRSMATVNPFVRASLMDQTKNLLVAIFVLILIPIIFRLMFSMSASLTSVFSSALGDITATDRFKALSVNSGNLGGCLMQICYIGALLYFNFFYMMRAVTIALLVVLSPIFIVLYSVGGGAQQLTGSWARELMANVLIQPLQSFALTLILLLPSTSRSFENLVLIYMLIPFTSMVRSLFFGTSGGLLHNLSQQGQHSAEGGLKFAGKMAGGAALGVAGAAVAAGRGVAGKSSGSSDFGNQTTEKNMPDEIKSKDFETKGASFGERVMQSRVGQTAESLADKMRESSVGQTAGSAATAIKESPIGQTVSNIANNPVVGKVAGAAGAAVTSSMNLAGGVALSAVGGSLSAVGARSLGRGMTQMGDDWALKGGSGFRAAGAALVGAGVVHASGETSAQPLHTLDQNSRGFSTGDGGMSYTIPQESFNEHGFESVSENRKGGIDYVTGDTGFRGVNDAGDAKWEPLSSTVIDQSDCKGFASMANTFATGTDAEREVLKQNGFEHVSAETMNGIPTGRFAVSTNRNLPEGVGYQSKVTAEGNLELHQNAASAGSPLYRAPQQNLTEPTVYQRTTASGQGYTSSGIMLKTGVTQPVSMASNGTPVPVPQAAGITQVEPSGNSNVTVTYDTGIMGQDDSGATIYSEQSTMSITDRDNLAQAAQMWANGSDGDRNFLQQIGYQDLKQNGNGSITAVYNQNASRLMGGVLQQGPAAMGPGEVKTSINMNSSEVRERAKASKTKVHIPKQNRGKPN